MVLPPVMPISLEEYRTLILGDDLPLRLIGRPSPLTPYVEWLSGINWTGYITLECVHDSTIAYHRNLLEFMFAGYQMWSHAKIGWLCGFEVYPVCHVHILLTSDLPIDLGFFRSFLHLYPVWYNIQPYDGKLNGLYYVLKRSKTPPNEWDLSPSLKEFLPISLAEFKEKFSIPQQYPVLPARVLPTPTRPLSRSSRNVCKRK